MILEEGNNTFRVDVTGSRFNLNWLQLDQIAQQTDVMVQAMTSFGDEEDYAESSVTGSMNQDLNVSLIDLF